jgi:hypothetical protein
VRRRASISVIAVSSIASSPICSIACEFGTCRPNATTSVSGSSLVRAPVIWDRALDLASPRRSQPCRRQPGCSPRIAPPPSDAPRPSDRCRTAPGRDSHATLREN